MQAGSRRVKTCADDDDDDDDDMLMMMMEGWREEFVFFEAESCIRRSHVATPWACVVCVTRLLVHN